MSHEQRKNMRKLCVVPVDDAVDGVFAQSLATDISRGGLGFFSRQEIPLNKEIIVELDLTLDGAPVFVVGKVQWVRSLPDDQEGYRIGMSFVQILQGSKTRLNKYFDQI